MSVLSVLLFLYAGMLTWGTLSLIGNSDFPSKFKVSLTMVNGFGVVIMVLAALAL